MSKTMKLTAEQKSFIPYGIGAGMGVVIPIVLKKYIDGNEPYDHLWQKPSIWVPILTGIGALALVNFTKIVKKKNLRESLTVYGITASLAGILASVWGTGLMGQAQASLGNGCSSCAAKAQYKNLRNAGGHTNLGTQTTTGIPSVHWGYANPPDYWSNQYYPNFQGNFYNRYDTRARGWGSDVTRNPKAAIPTTIPPTEIIA